MGKKRLGVKPAASNNEEDAIPTFQLTYKCYPKFSLASKALSRLQKKYNINVTLGGTEEE